jgi:ribosomal protein S18 acetylase RimI-like enzyme
LTQRYRPAPMPKLEIRPFSGEHLDDAAGLLAERHRRHRTAEPLLPARFESSADALQEVTSAWEAEGASGAIAFRARQAVGFLFGSPRDSEVWGENRWVDYAGQAVEEPEDIRDLYAVAATRWVEEGATNHNVLAPAFHAALVEGWFRVGFGQQQGHGLREVAPTPPPAVPDGIEIRKPTPDDVDSLIDVDLALPRHQRASPVFSRRPLPTEQESREEWARTFAAGEEELFIGCVAGKPVAVWSLVDGRRSSYFHGLARPDKSCYLGYAATLPDFRGTGVGVALTGASFAWAAEAGYTSMGTDWRVTNLLASRFWPRRGFRTTFLRLYRHIP